MHSSLWLLCLAFSITSLISPMPPFAACSMEEDALLQLKQGFGHPTKLSSWNRSVNASPCKGWTGITCRAKSTTVVRISLQGVGLAGKTISSAIGNLPNLQYIDLSGNALIGKIPIEITHLRSLVHLDLAHNALTGGLPEVWSNLTKLVNLTLSSNNLRGPIPIGLSEAKSLTRLRVENNSVSGPIPPNLFTNTAQVLKYFAVEFNNISGRIPEEVGQCTSLKSFYAAGNHLNGSLPESMGNLTNLIHFEVEDNELSGPLPDSISNLTQSLLTFNLSGNNFTGQIPASLSSKFNASSFGGNPSLCGLPLLTTCSSVVDVPHPPFFYREPPASPSGNHVYQPTYNMKKSSIQTGKIVGGIVGGTLGGACLLLLLFIVLFRRHKKEAHPSQVQNWFSPDIQDNRRKGKFQVFCRDFQYSYEEIVASAGYFDTAHVVGKGRFGTVYRSDLPDNTQLAIKVFKFANVASNFEKEMEMLALIQHRNILSAKGFYTNPVEKAVFYDYLPTGTLYELLHGQSNSLTTSNHEAQVIQGTLPDWYARHRIALGVAHAMVYLHRGCGYKILHRDLKSTNILLQPDLTPRVSDHGIVHMVSGMPGAATHDVVETPGYTAPEVLTSKKYTEKSDVYSYGVVLLEILTGKKAVSYVRERSMSLTRWVVRLHEEGRRREVLDAVAVKTCPTLENLNKVLDLAILCVHPNPSIRPTMAEVATVLEGCSSSSSTASPQRSQEMRLDMPLLPSYNNR